MLYTMVQDSNKYRSLLWDDKQITSLVGAQDMEKRIDMWNSPRSFKGLFSETLRVNFSALSKLSENLLIPDMCVFQGRLFLNPKAYDALEKLIAQDGEFLPVTYELGDAYIFTPLRVAEQANALDTKLSRKNEWGDLENLAFHEEQVKDWAVFRAEYDLFMSLQCQQSVKDAVDKAQLGGVFFTRELGNTFSNQMNNGAREKH